MTWMSGESKYTSTLSTFALALGYVWDDVNSDHGFKVHASAEHSKDMLSHCYPLEERDQNYPFITVMYPFYNMLMATSW